MREAHGGGRAAAFDAEFPRLRRLSLEGPAFIPPHDCLVRWQRSEPDLWQPLVMSRVPRDEVEAILGA